MNFSHIYLKKKNRDGFQLIIESFKILRFGCLRLGMNFSALFSMQICGEHKESGILRHGFFASPFSQGVGSAEVESEIKERHRGRFI